MSKSERAGENLCDLAALYPLGVLDAGEKIAFEDHLRDGCTTCASDVRDFEGVAAAIGEAVPADPPAKLRDRLLSKVRQTPRVPGLVIEGNGLLIERSAELPWQPLSAGIDWKLLYQDSDRHYATSLVRMQPGARYPSHRHKEVEELFLLSGDLHVEGEVMYAGDYCRASLDSVHGQTYTESGCLFLLMASQENQVL